MTQPSSEPDRDRPATQSAKGARLGSLDLFRGITVFAMIVVNDPGSWSSVYAPLRHAKWNGWTPTDLVFPSFLFIVGVSIALALAGRVDQGQSPTKLALRILIRSLVLFAIGLFLNGFPDFSLEKFRIPGVLQRIAVCYLLAALVFTSMGVRAQIALTVFLLLGYWAAMMLIPVPVHGSGDLSMRGNLAAYIDRTLLGKHIYKPYYDPEGILSTLPAVATTILGMLTGIWLRARVRTEKRSGETAVLLAVAGAMGVLIGIGWDYLFPINKALWSSSFVMLSTGMALLLLSFCYWRVEARGDRLWTTPFLALGTNAIAGYVLSGLGARLLGMTHIGKGPDAPNAHTYLYNHLFVSWLPSYPASLAWALVYASAITALMMILYARKIVIKV